MDAKNGILSLIEEIVETQKEKILKTGQEFIPNLTSDDILQPCDYPVLENNPSFRYEEGVLEGMQTIQSALFAYFKGVES